LSERVSPWWRGGVIYQIYARSFADSNGDGIGDLVGVSERLDYLEWLGIDAIWLSPVTPSPNADWGYDVSDYCDVHPELGTLADLDRLIADAARRGIRVLLDLVPNHTSDRHPWFVEARAARDAPRRDWYVWADAKPNGSLPNNWRRHIGEGPAWTFDAPTGQYYLHQFLPEQPDLNWWNDGVRDAFDEILCFWFDRGVAGFRIDVAHAIVKDQELRDNPIDADGNMLYVYNANRPEVHDVFRRWRSLGDEYDPPRLLVGETWVLDPSALASFYGRGDELQLAFNFSLLLSPFEPGTLRALVEAGEEAIPPEGWPTWAFSSHDVIRFPTRWFDGDDARIRCALVVLLALRGTPVVYYGDELGMQETSVPENARRDPGLRDGARTPMHWSPDDGAGFTTPAVEPWLPLGDHRGSNVEDQRRDPRSTLTLCRDLITLRRELTELREGTYESVEAPEHVWAWRRGERVTVAANMGDTPATVANVRGLIRVCTARDREGESVEELVLEPSEAAIVSASVSA
jgi:alpha-glucosidase